MRVDNAGPPGGTSGGGRPGAGLLVKYCARVPDQPLQSPSVAAMEPLERGLNSASFWVSTGRETLRLCPQGSAL